MSWNANVRQHYIAAIRKRDGYHCWLCHGKFSKADPVTIDHAIPKGRGGSNHLANLRLAHLSCNSERGMIVKTPPRAPQKRLAVLRLPMPILELTEEMRVGSAELQAAA